MNASETKVDEGCPFCGAPKGSCELKKETYEDFPEESEYFVECGECEARGVAGATKEEGYRNWNTRIKR